MSDVEVHSPYERVGGEAVVHALVGRFYQLMDTLPEAAACRAIHPPSLEGSARKLEEYLTYWLGGPSDYVARNGHPRLRMRHFPAAIGPVERDGWLLCFRQALAETVTDHTAAAELLPRVEALAMHMQNRA
ncbi:group II truncated hemoglobin [Xanthobacter sp. DSM 24535]|uniref:group II truncated hemoglobin n=1 Tax=Roseixanthobacter psychrophilus TaxID=3119917 RepID=UPI00372B8057